MASLLLYFVKLKHGHYSKIQLRSIPPAASLDSLRIFSCNAVNPEVSWHKNGPCCLDLQMSISDWAANGLVCCFPSLDLNSSCEFNLVLSSDLESSIGVCNISITYSLEQDQAAYCALVSGHEEDVLYVYYIFAHPYALPKTRAPAPQSICLTPVRSTDAIGTWPLHPPILIGHGGVGVKRAHYGPGPHWPDNTVCAFRRAEQLGLPVAECDATVTRDYRTVILHHNFTLRFIANSMSEGASERTYVLEHLPDPIVDEKTTNLIVNYSLAELRNMLGRGPCSVDTETDNVAGTLTHPSPLDSTDPPPDLASNQSFPLPELADVFQQTSVKLGVNVELKYPKETMLGKITQAVETGGLVDDKLSGPHLYFANINKFCDRILDTIWKHAGSRIIILSSFNADVCAVLRLKQSHFPVLFITRGGKSSGPEPELRYADLRHENLGVAIRWAGAMNLAGLVTLADFFCPGSSQSEKWSTELSERQLACFVYGVSEPTFIPNAIHFGLTGVIIDRAERFIQKRSEHSG